MIQKLNIVYYKFFINLDLIVMEYLSILSFKHFIIISKLFDRTTEKLFSIKITVEP